MTRTPLPGPAPAAAIAFLAGAAVLAIEVAGARVFIPWYGSSVLVWSSVIGVTLGAIAAGNLLGGVVADRQPRAALLPLLLAGSGVLAGAIPFLVGVLGRRYVPAELPLEAALSLIGRAALLTAIVALGPPLLLLGMATPLLVRGALRAERIGRAAGLVTGAGTIGSLVGTFLPVHVLIPRFGSRATFLGAGAFLLLAAAIALLAAGRRAPRARAGAAIAIAGALLVWLAATGGGPLRSEITAGVRILAELETAYQYARVEDDGERVVLRLNEGLDSFHSMTVKGQVLTGGAYFDHYNLFLPAAARDGSARVLLLGFAAGTIARQFLAFYGEAYDLRITGVELDPAVAALASEHFGLPDDPRIEIVAGQDARVVLDHAEGAYDLIVVDTYAQQIYVPFQTCSREFFASARARLADGGILTANLSGFSPEDEPVRAIRNTAAAEFDTVGMLRVSGGRNFVLAARKGAAPPEPWSDASLAFPKDLASLVDAARSPGAFRVSRFDPELPVLTDDRSPIEVLADRDLRRRSRALLAPRDES